MWFEDLKKDFTYPYDKKNNFYLCLESMARYQFCADFIVDKGIEEVVDIGFANGYGAEYMAQVAKWVYGTEVRDDLSDEANKNMNLAGIKNITYYPKEMHIEKTYIKDKKFKLITCLQTLAVLEKPEEALKNIHNMLDDEGYLIVSVPNAKFEPMLPNGKSAYKSHIQLFSMDRIKNMLKEIGFDIVGEYGQPLSVKLFHREFELIDKHEYSEKKIRSWYRRDKESVDYFARLIAYPTKNDATKSNSMIFVCKKQ